MADNLGYTEGSGAKVATDDLVTLNGAAVSEAQHAQRMKVGFGADGDFNDVNGNSPLPVFDAQIADVDFTLTRVLNALNAPQGFDKSLQRQRGTVVVESGTVTTVSTVTTVTTVSTVSTLSNIVAIDGLQPRIQIYGANLSAWADTTRARIT